MSFTRIADPVEKRMCLCACGNAIRSPGLIGRGNSERLHLAVKMAALEAKGGGRLRHIPAVLLKLAEDEFALVGAARFVQRGIKMLRTLGYAAEKLRRKVVRLDARLRAHNYQPLHQVSQFAHIPRPGKAQQDFHRRIAEFPCFLSVCGTEFTQKISCQCGDIFLAIAQGRHEKRNYVEPVKKVLAKSAA